MKKSAVAVTAAFLVASAVVPAMALDVKFSGEFRTRGEEFNEHFLESDFYNDVNGAFPGTFASNEARKNSSLWDSRMRLKMDLAVNDNLKGVYVMQVGDITWGSDGGNNTANYPLLHGGVFADRRIRNDHKGGGLDTNGINVETKNMYIDFNVPSTPINGKVGLLPLKLGHGIVLDADVAGLVGQVKTDTVTAGAATFKASEGNIEGSAVPSINETSDSDYYLLFANASLQNSGSVGLFGIYNENGQGVGDGSDLLPAGVTATGARIKQSWLGITADLNPGPLFVNLEVDEYWATLDEHKVAEAAGASRPKAHNQHVEGTAAYLNVGANVKPVKVGVAGLYATGQGHVGKKAHTNDLDFFSPLLPTRPQDKTLLDWDTIVVGQLKQNILSNLVSLKGYVDVSPADMLTLGVSAQPYWLQQGRDEAGYGNGRYLGTEADANLTVKIYGDNLVYKLSYAYMWTSNEVFGVKHGDTVNTTTVTGSENAPSRLDGTPFTAIDEKYNHQNIWFLGHQLVYTF